MAHAGADIARLQRENRDSDAALAQARADFARELDRLREDAQRSEERLRAAEKRALLEIERKRALAARLRKIWRLRYGGPSSLTSVIALRRCFKKSYDYC